MADEKREFVRNYELCYLTVTTPKTGVCRPFVPLNINSSGDISGVLLTKSLQEKVTSFSYDYLCEKASPLVPSAGYYNVEIEGVRPMAMYVDLLPARQYRKALDSQGGVRVDVVPNASPTLIKELDDLPKGNILYLKSKLLAFSLAKNPGRNFLSFRDAVRRVESGEYHSAAVSRFVAVALFSNFRCPIILFKNNIAGVVDGNTVAGNEQLLPLKDFFEKRWNISLKSFKELA